MKMFKSQIHRRTSFLLIILFALIRKTSSAVFFGRAGQGISNLLTLNIPATTTDVRLQGNLATFLPTGVFRSRHSKLLTISLVNNRIADVEDFSLAAVPSLTYVWLRQNKLQELRKNMFAGRHT